MWTIKFRNGNMKRFKFPIRTTAEGAANDYAGTKCTNLDDEQLALEGSLPQPTKLAK
jgi:adenylylsulfate reductase subunit B